MNRLLTLSFILFISAIACMAESVEYRIVSGGQNKISLEVEKTGLLRGKKHLFDFPKFEGKLLYDDAAPQNSKVDLRIDAAAVTCNDTWLKDGDRKKVLDYTLNDMLAVKQYPEIRFVSTKVVPKGNAKFTVEGTLTLRGTGHPVALDAELTSSGMWIDGKSVVKITGFGLKPPSAALGAIGTKDEITALFHVGAAK